MLVHVGGQQRLFKGHLYIWEKVSLTWQVSLRHRFLDMGQIKESVPWSCWSQVVLSSQCPLITGCPLVTVSPDHRLSSRHSVPWSQVVLSSQCPLITGCPLVTVSPDHRLSSRHSVPWSQVVLSSQCPLITGCPLVTVSPDHRFYCTSGPGMSIFRLFTNFRVLLSKISNLAISAMTGRCQKRQNDKYFGEN